LSDQPLAVIDIGSNSGRMIIVRSPTGRHLETLGEGRAPLRLASDLAATGSIGPAAFERTVQCVDDFLAHGRAAGVARTIAVATAAVRDADNGEEFIGRVRTHTHVDIDVIDGAREAELAFLGAVHSLPVHSGLLLDVGGGSIELTRFRDRRLTKAWTLPVGALLMADRFFNEDPPARSERRKLVDHIGDAIRDSALPTMTRNEGLAGTGGTIRNLAKMDRRERSYPLSRLHGYVLALSRVDELISLLSSRPLAKRAQLAGLNPDRADSIVAGAIVLHTIMEAMGAEEITVSGKGLREGIAMEALMPEMPSPVDVRAASIRGLAGRFASWEPPRAERRAALAAEIFDATSISRDGDAKELLTHAAAILDAGAALDAYNRHEHAGAAVLAGDLSGFSHPQLAFIAAILRRADKEDAGVKPLRALLRTYDPTTVTRAATALAIADAVDMRLAPDASASVRSTKTTISVVGPLVAGRWSELLSSRARTTLGRAFAVKTREDE